LTDILEVYSEQEDQAETSAFLMKALYTSIFMLMVVEFNSLVTPLIIMFSVLLSLIASFRLLVTNTPLG
jgi:multidrug efflux pump subunit AcrB